MDFDEVLHMLGECGLYQRVLCFVVCLVGIPSAFVSMGIVFIAGVPEHWCAPNPILINMSLPEDLLKNLTIPVDSEGKFSSCSMYAWNYSSFTEEQLRMEALYQKDDVPVVKCQFGWNYDRSLYESTLVTEWDLVCDKSWLVATISSVYMAGLMVGVLFFGFISDLLGRRPAFIITIILTTVSSISQAFAPSYLVFAITRFICAACNLGIYTTAFIIAIELVGPSYRAHAGLTIMYTWALGYMGIALLAKAVTAWRMLALVLSAPYTLFLLLIFFVPESPRWLYTNKKKKEGDDVVRKIAKWNNVELPEKLEITMKNEKKGFIWDLVQTPVLRRRTLNLFFNWFVNSVVYYGLSLNTSNLGGDPYINFFISAAVEVPAYIFCQLSLTFLGRRLPLISTMVLGGVALLSTMAVPEDLHWLSIALAMFGKLCISASFAIIYVFSGELYPTLIRNVGVGTGSFFARVGGVVAPYVALLSAYGRVIPLIVFGTLSLAAGLLVILLPETRGHNLPETIEDGENFGRDQNIWGVQKRGCKYDISTETTIAVRTINGGGVNPAYDASDVS